jgi:hypothetical protein
VAIAASLKFESVITTMPSASIEAHRRIAALSVRAGVKAMVLHALNHAC